MVKVGCCWMSGLRNGGREVGGWLVTHTASRAAGGYQGDGSGRGNRSEKGTAARVGSGIRAPFWLKGRVNGSNKHGLGPASLC